MTPKAPDDRLALDPDALALLADVMAESARAMRSGLTTSRRMRDWLATISSLPAAAATAIDSAERRLSSALLVLDTDEQDLRARLKRLHDSGNGRQSGPSGAPTATASAAAAREVLRGIRARLRHSVRGRRALRLFRKYGIHFRLTSGIVARYSGRTNTISMPRSYGSEEAALTFVHEMLHAEYDARNRTAMEGITSLSRETFIRRQLHEERRAVVLTIIAEAEVNLDLTGSPTIGTAPGADIYQRAGEEAMRDAKRGNPYIGQDELNAAARRGGEAAILAALKDGRLAPTAKTTYPEFYGRAWDAANGR